MTKTAENSYPFRSRTVPIALDTFSALFEFGALFYISSTLERSIDFWAESEHFLAFWETFQHIFHNFPHVKCNILSLKCFQ